MRVVRGFGQSWFDLSHLLGVAEKRYFIFSLHDSFLFLKYNCHVFSLVVFVIMLKWLHLSPVGTDEI